MTWVRVDDKALQHPKLLSVGAEGVCLWLAGLCHCNSFATDGMIRKEFLEALYAPFGRGVARRVAARLVAVGLWNDAGPSFEVHDYEQYQAEALKEEADSRAAVAVARKRRDRDRKRVERAEKRGAVHDVSHGQSERTNGTRPRGQDVGQASDCPDPVHGSRARGRAPVSRPGPSRPSDPDLDLEGFQRSGVVVAILDRGASKPPPPPLEASESSGESRLTGQDAAILWHRVMGMPNAGVAGAVHPFKRWREDFETIACACNGVQGKPVLALQVVCEWFWLAPDGPIQSGRVTRATATPEVFANGILRDLESALSWWAQRKQQQVQTGREGRAE